MIKKLVFKRLTWVLIFFIGISIGYLYPTRIHPQAALGIQQQQNKYMAFLDEVFSKVKDNYWDNLSDEQLTTLFKLSSEKLLGTPLNVKSQNKTEVFTEIEKTINNMEEGKRKEFTVKLTGSILSNLQPTQRSGLFTQKQEQQLKNTVQNINPEKDLYKDLGVAKGASSEAVQQAFEQKSQELQKLNSPEATQELKKIAYAKQVLTQDDQKQRYDSSGVEPTIFTKILPGNILYLKFLKFSPTTYDEFQKVVNSFDKTDGPKAMILDLKQNIGGAIDSLSFFLGDFIGKNQYAFDFYKRGEPIPFRTTADKLSGLSRYRQLVVLQDNRTQSSAELMSAVIKRYNLGIVVGTNSKGWGTVESIYPLDHQIVDNEKYSIFLVHHITLRDDGQPIEGRGVEPNINTADSKWEDKLSEFYNNSSLTQAVKLALTQNLVE